MTAVFSLVNGVLLDPLPGARNLDRVVFAGRREPRSAIATSFRGAS